MKKAVIATMYALMAVLVIGVFFLFPREFVKKADTDPSPQEKPVQITFSRVSQFYETREEAQNRRVMTVYTREFRDEKDVWMQIFDYANKLPLTRGGFTAVFFFDHPAYTPVVSSFTETFDRIHEDHCIAGYWKYSNGTDIFRRYPFKRDEK
jgi:hypothetical protein